MSETSSRSAVAVRFQGGLGDHILAMRILPFIRDRYPHHDIIVYSDARGHSAPLQITAMSPYVARIVPVRANGHDHKLQNICAEDLLAMQSADLLIDTWGENMFTDAAVALSVPIFDILAQRPALIVPPEANSAAADHLREYASSVCIGLNLSTHGAELLTHYPSRIPHVLRRLLEVPDVIILNICSSCYNFPHWPEPWRSLRRGRSMYEYELLKRMSSLSTRIVPCVDLPITTVAALIKRCSYFIGVDNGVKHLAWGLDVPLTYFHFGRPRMRHTLRWMPDLHRMLSFDCSDAVVMSHIESALAAVDRRRTSTI